MLAEENGTQSMTIKDKNDKAAIENEEVMQRLTENCNALLKAQMDPTVQNEVQKNWINYHHQI